MYQNYYDVGSQPKLIQAFVGPVTNTGISTDWRIWTKPDNISLVMIIAIGGGGGGGRGYSSTTTTQSAGGGGGGTGGTIFKTLIPADILPNTLYVKPGYGGTGAKTGVNAAGGGNTYVSLNPTLATGPALITCGAGNGGANGTATAGGAAGTFAAISQYSNSELRWVGIHSISGPPPATAGSLATNALPVNLISPNQWNISIHNTGGAGGGGVDNSIPPPVAYNGGSINLPPSMLSSLNISYANNTIPGGAGGSFGVNGENGLNYGLDLTNNLNNLNILYPLIFTGGAGGGAAVSGTGYPAGNGGHGGIGSGGGGGGASLPRTAGTVGPPGDGGNGGPGLVLFVCG